MKKRFEFRLKTIILWVLWPALLLLTVLMAQLVYSDLYNTILQGFEKKLKSVGCATASFVSGEEHDLLLEMRQATGFAGSARRGQLYASFSTAPLLDIYDLRTRRLLQRLRISFAEMGDLAYADDKGVLYGLNGNPAELITLDTATGAGKKLFSFKKGCSGLAYRPDGGFLYTVRDGTLYRFTPEAPGSGKDLGSVALKSLTGLTWLAERRQLWAVDVLSVSLVQLNPENGAVMRRIAMHGGKDAKGVAQSPFSMPSWGLAFDPVNRAFVTGTPVSMARISPEDGLMQKLTVPGDLWQKARGVYEQLVQPFFRIKEQLNLSFLITTTMVNNFRNIFYVLDASRADDHSFIGYVDPTESERATSDVIVKGKVFLSDIKFWEDWGLMKSSYVPIVDRQNKPRAMVTTDINIDIIRNKTRDAFNRVMLGGLVSILIGMIAAFYIARRIVKPIISLKNFALQVAAGNYGAHSRITEPRELEELSVSFNAMSSTLKNTLDDLEHANRRLETSRRHSQLVQQLFREADQSTPQTSLAAVGRRSGRLDATSVSGWSCANGTVLLWFGAPLDSGFETARLRRDLSVLAARLLEQGMDPAEIQPLLSAAGSDRVAALVPADGRLVYYGSGELQCRYRLRESSGPVLKKLQSGETLQLEDGGSVLVSEFLQQSEAAPVEFGSATATAAELLQGFHERLPEAAAGTISAVMVRSL